MAQQVRTLVAYPQGLCFPEPTKQLTILFNSSERGSDTLWWPPLLPPLYTQYNQWQTQVIRQQQQTLCTEKYYGIHCSFEKMLWKMFSSKDNTLYKKGEKNKRKDISLSFAIENRFYYLSCFSSILHENMFTIRKKGNIFLVECFN